MTFTESVNLSTRRHRLVDDAGATVPTPDPTVDGHCQLADASRSAGWGLRRMAVVSADGHPVSALLRVGTARAVPGPATGAGSADTTGSTVATGSSAPWPVVAVRLVGYVAFALPAGVPRSCCFAHRTPAKSPSQRPTRGVLVGAARSRSRRPSWSRDRTRPVSR